MFFIRHFLGFYLSNILRNASVGGLEVCNTEYDLISIRCIVRSFGRKPVLVQQRNRGSNFWGWPRDRRPSQWKMWIRGTFVTPTRLAGIRRREVVPPPPLTRDRPNRTRRHTNDRTVRNNYDVKPRRCVLLLTSIHDTPIGQTRFARPSRKKKKQNYSNDNNCGAAVCRTPADDADGDRVVSTSVRRARRHRNKS